MAQPECRITDMGRLDWPLETARVCGHDPRRSKYLFAKSVDRGHKLDGTCWDQSGLREAQGDGFQSVDRSHGIL